MKEKQQGKHSLEATGWKINHVTLRETKIRDFLSS